MRYLRGSTNINFVYHSNKSTNSIVGYVYSDYAGDLGKRQSLIGHVSSLFLVVL